MIDTAVEYFVSCIDEAIVFYPLSGGEAYYDTTHRIQYQHSIITRYLMI